jgi:integrase
MRVKLTDKFVAAAKPLAGKQTDYFDSVTHGLSLRASDTRRTWCYVFTSPRGGKRARVTLGTYPAQSLAGARALALQARGYVEAGTDPRDALAAQAPSQATLAGLIESYLQRHAWPNLRTAPAIERRLRRNVLPIIGSTRVADLHRRDINRVVDPIMARGRPIEANRVFGDVHAALGWAVARGDIDGHPMIGMAKPAEPRQRERVLSDEEIRQLWHRLPTSLAKSKACQRIIRLCLVTAQRVGEVAGMRLDELDLAAMAWALPGSRTKNGHGHLVPLSDMAVGIIREAIADAGGSPFVFPRGSGPLAAARVSRAVWVANRDCRFPIPHWTVHDLRRTAVTGMARLGIPPIVAGAVANHTSVTKATITLSVYTQYTYEREKRDALDRWAERLAAIVGG